MKSIIMQDFSVRAILEGRKTQTRRIVKPQPYDGLHDHDRFPMSLESKLEGWWGETYKGEGREWIPKYQVGDRIRVKEAWQQLQTWQEHGETFTDTIPKGRIGTNRFIEYRATNESGWDGSWKSPLLMPKWDYRLVLKIESVRCERLGDITEVGAIDEGVMNPALLPELFPEYVAACAEYKSTGNLNIAPPLGPSPRHRFQRLWDSLHAKPKRVKASPFTGKPEDCYAAYPSIGEPRKTYKNVTREFIAGDLVKHKTKVPVYIIPNPYVWVYTFRRV